MDTSAIIAVIINEPRREAILDYAADSAPIVPASVHWEVGNAFSAMFKRGRITLAQAKLAMRDYERMRFRFIDIDLEQSLELSEQLDIYAYDAYVIASAYNLRLPLLTLDSGLAAVAPMIGVRVLEVNP